ncbi:hypothetical protein AYI70_g2593 [Smittium culicis]|uniref:Uncharacterized protein n=1 Tax=Smittium culicis TaxID=133412 RepID=A0A1R1Y7D3_9FUNG|nr:hypothetical protein AYI70_g2593 [Smittium culicis]
MHIMNVHLPSNSTRRKKLSEEIVSYMIRAKNKFRKHVIFEDFNMDVKAAKKIILKTGAGLQRENPTKSTGSRWHKGKTGRMIDHIFLQWYFRKRKYVHCI